MRWRRSSRSICFPRPTILKLYPNLQESESGRWASRDAESWIGHDIPRTEWLRTDINRTVHACSISLALHRSETAGRAASISQTSRPPVYKVKQQPINQSYSDEQ